MSARANPPRRGEPVHIVLDSRALSELSSERPARTLLVALEAAVVTTSDPADLAALLAAEPDTEVRSRATVRVV